MSGRPLKKEAIIPIRPKARVSRARVIASAILVLYCWGIIIWQLLK
jgi:hypothetical protein